MKINKPEIVIDSGKLTYRVRVESLQGVGTLWYSFDEQYQDLVTESSDAALVALLLPAMARGEDIHIDGVISEKLFYNLSGRLQKLLQLVAPALLRVKVYPAGLQTDSSKGTGVATGFSGGIDSFCVLADHFFSEYPPGFKITHLLFNNVGSHGWGGEQLFKERFERLIPVTERMGIPFISINSNIESFYGGKDYLGFQPTHTLRNASVALLLQAGIQRYMYASGLSFSNIFVGPTNDMANIDSILLPILSTEAIDAFSVGGEYTRVEKTLRVNEIPVSYDTLDVCVEPDQTGKNCSKCWKCLRTLLTLDIAGFLDNYSASFYINIYLQHRDEFIKEVIQSDYALLLEIVEFAKRSNYRLV